MHGIPFNPSTSLGLKIWKLVSLCPQQNDELSPHVKTYWWRQAIGLSKTVIESDIHETMYYSANEWQITIAKESGNSDLQVPVAFIH